MSWNGMTDRRKFKRSAIRIQSEFGDPKNPTRIETVDFSAGGFSCHLDRPLEALTRLALHFEFPAFGEWPAHSIPCDAVVVRCEKRPGARDGWTVAAAFTGISAEDREYMSRYVAWHEAVNAPRLDGVDEE
jgi:hypothetical protein